IVSTTLDSGTSALGWGPNGHPLVLQGNQNPTAAYMTLHWDGDTILFITDAAGNVIDFKAGLDGEIAPRDPYQTALLAYARDSAGVIIGTTINGQATVNVLDPQNGTGTAAPILMYAPYVRPDGFTIGGIQINGVRAFDSRLQSWTTPDAYAGDIHDPASQQKYMWNRGNPIDYSDPSGFCPCMGGIDWGFETRFWTHAQEVMHVIILGGITAIEAAAAAGGGAAAARAGQGQAQTNASRAAEIHSGHDQFAVKLRTTAVSTTSSGRTLVSTSTTKSPHPGVQAMGRGGEEMVSAGKGDASQHAEIKAMENALAHGETVTSIGVTRPPCALCLPRIEEHGAFVSVRRP
ncbi:MAG TPA: hypothetical protein VII30_05345, partial [Gemmatimonadaceae bacterium]